MRRRQRTRRSNYIEQRHVAHRCERVDARCVAFERGRVHRHVLDETSAKSRLLDQALDEESLEWHAPQCPPLLGERFGLVKQRPPLRYPGVAPERLGQLELY